LPLKAGVSTGGRRSSRREVHAKHRGQDLVEGSEGVRQDSQAGPVVEASALRMNTCDAVILIPILRYCVGVGFILLHRKAKRGVGARVFQLCTGPAIRRLACSFHMLTVPMPVPVPLVLLRSQC